MKILYLDIFSGISGDMFLGALIDLGVSPAALETELAKLKLAGYHLHIRKRTAANIRGIKFDVHVEDDHVHDHEETQLHQPHAHRSGHHHEHSPAPERNFADIKALIEKSKLSAWVKQKAVAIFRRIAAAEGKVHGCQLDDVHFHEVGAVDSIVDIVGACIALEQLGKPRVLAAPVVDGSGWVDCAHGRFPVPTAATLEILGARGIPVTQSDEPHELVTPTGAALLAEFVERFGPMTGLAAEKIGYGLGSRQLKTRPNCLRAVLGMVNASLTADTPVLDWETDTVAVLETNLDDISAEVLGYFSEKALASGALDVFYTPVTMKKNRPGVVLTILCAETESDRFAELILRETTAFGVRCHSAARRKLRRESVKVQTPHGQVAVKLGKLQGQVVQTAPEFETCKETAVRAGVPVKAVYEAAIQCLKPRKKVKR